MKRTVRLRVAAALLIPTVLLGACGDSPEADTAVAPEVSAAVAAAAAPLPWPADLAVPELRTVGDIPSGALVVVIREDGTFRWKGEPASWSEIVGLLDATDDAPVLIASHRDAPWGSLQAVMMGCASAGLVRVFHAAEPAPGGAPGAFATYLPRDRGLHDAVSPDVPKTTVKITTEWPPSDVLGVHAPLSERRGHVVEIDAPPSTPAGRVLRIADVACLEGAATVWFAGAPLAFDDADWAASAAGWLEGDRARHILVAGEGVGGPPPLIPVGERVVGRTAGFDTPYDGPWPEEETAPVESDD